MKYKSLVYFLLLTIFSSCVDPLDVELSDQGGKLIVYGEINNLYESYTVYLSRTSSYSKAVNPVEEGAAVSVVNSTGEVFLMEEIEPGVYQSCPESFVGEIGESYKLEITTADDKKYASNYQEILKPVSMDSIYFEDDEQPVEIEGELYDEKGIRFYCDFTDGPEKDYLKIDWKGTFKFQASGFDEYHDFCWKSENGNSISLYDDIYANNQQYSRYEVNFLEKGFRFKDGYSFQARINSMNSEAFHFWELVAQQYENDGSVFSSLPAKIRSNIQAEADETEEVLGYFFTYGVAEKRVRVSEFHYQDIDAQLPQCVPFRPGNWMPDHCYDCSVYTESTSERPDYW